MPIGDTLTKKAGPLPVWAWAGIGTAGLAAILVYRKKKADAAAAAAAQDTGDSSNLGTVPVSNLTTSASPMPIQMGDTFVNVDDDTPDVDNPGGGKVPPPKPVPNPKRPPHKPMPPPPTPGKPPSPPTKKRTVTVCAWPGWCGSLSGIAKHFYGNANEWPKIYQANKALIGANPNKLHPGQVLTVP